ncbi:MAG TPA: GMC family oxidoreductase [Polyangiaceae bacterium]|nr:GMC family oxidoreductase [Polyangiaceae bacterium]
MNQTEWDAVIVGAGVAGALTAKHLTRAGLRVLLLEAGPATAETLSGYDEHVRRYHEATSKGPESPWPASPNAPHPDTANLQYNNGYFVQNGPQLYGSSYTRMQGGSTLHWLGVSLRMLPEDFALRSRYGVGRDWPLRYEELEPYYRKAELELGVSADVTEQKYNGLTFADGYDYPMQRVPPSFSDQKLAAAVNGMQVQLEDTSVALEVRVYPAARNSVPRGEYTPVGGVERTSDGQFALRDIGERCQGNTSCTPICPVQARYHAGKSLAQARGDKLELLAQAVASRINVDPATGAVRSITYQRYDGTSHSVHEAKGRVYVLAAHAVENAKLMLASELGGPKGLVGRNLMDHPALYAWGLAPEPVGPFRGPLSTSGIEELRCGAFRTKHAAFRFDIGNDGWRATTGAPDTTVANAVMKQRRFGKDLRKQLAAQLSRQVRFSLAIEQLPDPSNRVSVDRRFLDPLGNPRPAINYSIDEYTLGGMVAATRVYQEVFRRAGITDYTHLDESGWFPSVKYGETLFHYHGMGHFAGTHVMGNDPGDSVVDAHQRCWEHRNLYLVGSGSFPTMGTSNPTLTLSALALRTAEHLVRELG